MSGASTTTVMPQKQQRPRLTKLREVSHPVLDRILLERDEYCRLMQFCRALVLFEELETVLREAESHERTATVERLLIALDVMRSKLRKSD